ncbi:MAG TPA: small ribosomal subunit Rsm22 family protein [Bacteroidota bacterium]|nr:small ribosomal subunit Rsm22 family protein [Bacteroidota bacterium]
MFTDTLHLPTWWPDILDRLASVDVNNNARVQRLLPSIQRLSGHFNSADRGASPLPPRYLADGPLRQAYLLYFVTANLLKPLPPLRELLLAGLPGDGRTLRVFDLGCGPGTGLLALLAFLDAHAPDIALEYTGMDVVPAALREVERVAAMLAPRSAGLRVRTQLLDLDRAAPACGDADLVLMMNALNELAPSTDETRLRALHASLRPDARVLLLEPALRHSSRRLLRLRDVAVREGWAVFAPCLRQQHCPALADERDWCHADVPWERPAWYADMDEALGNVKRSLKFSYLTLSLDGATLEGQLPRIAMPEAGGSAVHARVVSELVDEKGRYRCFLCDARGRLACQINKRDLGDSNGDFARLGRYDIVLAAGSEDAPALRKFGKGSVLRRVEGGVKSKE